jgi:hypothetical protein
MLLSLLLLSACGQKEDSEKQTVTTDRGSNDGLLRFVLAGKSMHDSFFSAQFTPRGDLFKKDNLQLYNFNPESNKYPRFLINIDYQQSDLKQWKGKRFPLDYLAFTPSPGAKPLKSRGELLITTVTERYIEGQFAGELYKPSTGQRFPIRGEFRAQLEYNI